MLRRLFLALALLASPAAQAVDFGPPMPRAARNLDSEAGWLKATPGSPIVGFKKIPISALEIGTQSLRLALSEESEQIIDTVGYEAFPQAFRMSDGTIVSFTYYSPAGVHPGPDAAGVVYMRKTTDGGKTISTPTTILSEAGMDLRFGAAGRAHDDSLFIVVPRYNNTTATYVSQRVFKSEDGGATWVQKANITSGFPYGSMIEIPLDDGSYKLCFNSYSAGQARIICSNDNGETWPATQTVMVPSNGKTATFAVSGATGNGTNVTFTHADSGATWTVGTEILIFSANPSSYNGVYTITASAPGSVTVASTNVAPFTSASITGNIYSETGLAYLGGRTVIGFVRQRDGFNQGWRCVISRDDAATWSQCGDTTFDNSNVPGPVWLNRAVDPASGRAILVMTYQNREQRKVRQIEALVSRVLSTGAAAFTPGMIREIGTFTNAVSGYPTFVPHCDDCRGGLALWYDEKPGSTLPLDADLMTAYVGDGGTPTPMGVLAPTPSGAPMTGLGAGGTFAIGANGSLSIIELGVNSTNVPTLQGRDFSTNVARNIRMQPFGGGLAVGPTALGATRSAIEATAAGSGTPTANPSTDTAVGLVVSSSATSRILQSGVDGANSRAWLQATTNAGTTQTLALNPRGGTVSIGAGLSAPALPTTGGTVRGTLCVDTAGVIYVKTTAGACL